MSLTFISQAMPPHVHLLHVRTFIAHNVHHHSKHCLQYGLSPDTSRGVGQVGYSRRCSGGWLEHPSGFRLTQAVILVQSSSAWWLAEAPDRVSFDTGCNPGSIIKSRKIDDDAGHLTIGDFTPGALRVSCCHDTIRVRVTQMLAMIGSRQMSRKTVP